MKEIILDTKEALDIYMNPQRQRLLRQMNLLGAPVTPKKLADILKISPSSVQHHLEKLKSLGLVEIHHTEQIRGITARFYAPCNTTVHIGLEKNDEFLDEREILIKNEVAGVLDTGLKKAKQAGSREGSMIGDIMTGISHLTPEEFENLLTQIREFVKTHNVPQEGTIPMEYALIMYRADSSNQ